MNSSLHLRNCAIELREDLMFEKSNYSPVVGFELKSLATISLNILSELACPET